MMQDLKEYVLITDINNWPDLPNNECKKNGTASDI